MKIVMLTALAETLRRRRNMNQTISALSKLNDRDLQDIGLHRSQIDSVARGLIDFHRTVRDVTERTTDDTNTD
jgi:uncharacterized protein YjiS (DUF1127 family)|tara:strand:- start:9767 stop:9985 length:219 start_codon:yes stop_codon:yes gene_type:complete